MHQLLKLPILFLSFTSIDSEAACSPIGVSLLSDLFHPRHRGTATGIFHWGIYFGYGLSYTIGVYVTRADVAGLGWRACFFMAGFPGLFIGTLLLLSPDVRRPVMAPDPVPLSDVNANDLEKDEEEAEEQKKFVEVEAEEKVKLLSHWKMASNRMRNTLAAFLQPVLLILFLAASFRHAGKEKVNWNKKEVDQAKKQILFSITFLCFHPQISS